jgi:hypothetical protein
MPGMLRERKEEGKEVVEIIRRRNPNPPEVRNTLISVFSSDLLRMRQGKSQ